MLPRGMLPRVTVHATAQSCYYQFIIFYYIISTSYYTLLLFSIKIEVYTLYKKHVTAEIFNMLLYVTAVHYMKYTYFNKYKKHQ
jgi:hypothetical protein